jgi:hypothetical protein
MVAISSFQSTTPASGRRAGGSNLARQEISSGPGVKLHSSAVMGPAAQHACGVVGSVTADPRS